MVRDDLQLSDADEEKGDEDDDERPRSGLQGYSYCIIIVLYCFKFPILTCFAVFVVVCLIIIFYCCCSDIEYDFDIMMRKKKQESARNRRRRKGVEYITDADDMITYLVEQMKEAARVRQH